MKNPSRKFVNLILCCGLLIVAGLIFSRVLFSNKTMPEFADGAYVGQIFGITGNPQPATFYLEHDLKTKLYLVIAFIKGWQPQAELFQHNSPTAMLQVHFQDKTYSFSGKQQDSQYSGKVFLNNEKVGTWSLRKISPIGLMELMTDRGYGKIHNQKQKESIFSEVINPPVDTALIDWLQIKAEFREYKAKIEENERILKDSEHKLEMLDEIVKDESMLKTRAIMRRDSLKQEVEQSRSRLKLQQQNLDELVGELGLLSRITKRGKVVELARRVEHRESSWYLANWPTDEEMGVVQELESLVPGMDPQKFNQAIERANKIRALTTEVAREKEKIKQLEDRLTQQQNIQIPTPSVEDLQGPDFRENIPVEQRKKKKSFWGEVFG